MNYGVGVCDRCGVINLRRGQERDCLLSLLPIMLLTRFLFFQLDVGVLMMSKLINYTVVAFTNEFLMNDFIKHCDETSKVWGPEMKKRGLKRWALTRIWNKGETFKVGILFEYDSKEAFEANVQYLEESFSSLPKTKDLMLMAKVEGSRGITVLEV